MRHTWQDIFDIKSLDLPFGVLGMADVEKTSTNIRKQSTVFIFTSKTSDAATNLKTNDNNVPLIQRWNTNYVATKQSRALHRADQPTTQ